MLRIVRELFFSFNILNIKMKSTGEKLMLEEYILLTKSDDIFIQKI